jgi:hypothetical protein
MDDQLGVLEALADCVRVVLAAVAMPGNPGYEFAPAPVSVDAAGDRVVVDVRAWTAWGPRTLMERALDEAFPGLVEAWTRTVYVFPRPGMRLIDREG